MRKSPAAAAVVTVVKHSSATDADPIGHVETQTMQTADCADRADCADCAD